MPAERRRPLPPGKVHFADVAAGDFYRTPSRTVTAADIDAFAELSGDRFAIHLDDEAARAYGFAGRVAHGLLVLSMVDGLKNQAETQFDAIASLGWDWRFSAPVLIGDTIVATITVIETRPTSNPARAILTLDFDVTNQHGTTVQAGTNKLMVHVR